MNLPKAELHKILFLDIETAVLEPDYYNLSDALKRSWDRKSHRFVRIHEHPLDEEEISSLYRDKAAIFAEFARIICISVGFVSKNGDGESELRVKSICHNLESDLLSDFSSLLNNYFYDRYQHFLCGHNIREFDLPFICRRLVIHGMPLPNLLNVGGQKPWQLTHLLDTLELWKFGDYKHYTSLDLLCSVLGIESPKSDLSGPEVSEAFWEGRLSEIVTYCQRDLEATAKVYFKLSGQEGPNKVQIVIAEEEE